MYKTVMAILIHFLLFSCSSPRKGICFKEYMNGHKFYYFSNDLVTGYFLINDTIQVEYTDEKFYAKSKVVWLNCNNYILIIADVNYNEGLKIGDTLYVNVLSLKKDTITYMASAYDQSYRFKAVRSN
jgi:hypothetical protein